MEKCRLTFGIEKLGWIIYSSVEYETEKLKLSIESTIFNVITSSALGGKTKNTIANYLGGKSDKILDTYSCASSSLSFLSVPFGKRPSAAPRHMSLSVSGLIISMISVPCL